MNFLLNKLVGIKKYYIFGHMPKDGNKTRTRILDEATSLVLENGFAGTTIDLILARTQITKGAFFYHFKSKSDLAFSLMEYFSKKDMNELSSSMADTKDLLDPKERLLAFVQWFIDAFKDLEAPYAGCLYASYIYEPEHFDQKIKDMVSKSILIWRKEIVDMIKKTTDTYNVNMDFDRDSLADHFTVILEGAFVTSKALNDASVTSKQLIHYKNYLNLLFTN